MVKGADFLVDGSSALGRKLKISSLIIGLTIVAFGTSLPELFVNVISTLSGNSSVAIGNIIGANIADILLVLGIASIMLTLKIQESTLTKEIPFAFLAACVLFFIALKPILDSSSATISRVDGFIMLLFFAIYLYYVYDTIRKDKGTKERAEDETEKVENLHSNLKITAMIIGGIIMLYFGGRWVVEGAVSFAEIMGISDF